MNRPDTHTSPRVWRQKVRNSPPRAADPDFHTIQKLDIFSCTRGWTALLSRGRRSQFRI